MKVKVKNTKRVVRNRIFLILLGSLSLFSLIPFISLIYRLIRENAGSLLQPDHFFQVPANTVDAMLSLLAGETVSGGVANGLQGSFLITLIALLFSLPLGVLGGVWFFRNDSRFSRFLFSLNGVLEGIPSVIAGLIIYFWVVRSLHGYSALAGGLALSLLLFPSITRHTFGTLRSLPDGLKESAYVLGIPYSCAIFRIFLPTAWRKLTSSILLAVSRTIGEAAPLTMTILGSYYINWDISKPVSALPFQIWNFFNNPYMVGFMWSAAFFLLLIILILNIIAKYIVLPKKLPYP